MRAAKKVELEDICFGGGRHPWNEEPDWEAVLAELGLDAIELLVELECVAEDVWRQALETMESELVLDPGLCADRECCQELGPWAWLRSTPLYRSLERQIDGNSVEDELWPRVPEAR